MVVTIPEEVSREEARPRRRFTRRQFIGLAALAALGSGAYWAGNNTTFGRSVVRTAHVLVGHIEPQFTVEIKGNTTFDYKNFPRGFPGEFNTRETFSKDHLLLPIAEHLRGYATGVILINLKYACGQYIVKAYQDAREMHLQDSSTGYNTRLFIPREVGLHNFRFDLMDEKNRSKTVNASVTFLDDNQLLEEVISLDMKPCRQRFREFSKHSQPRISDLVPQCYAFRKGGVDYFVSLDALVKGDRKLLEELWEHRVVYPTK